MKNDYWNYLIERLNVEKEHRYWVMLTDFALDIIIKILIVVAIGLVIISLA